ncbi:hypothetical protein BH24DEI2_BH24DEI2_11310 [soil metagenome]
MKIVVWLALALFATASAGELQTLHQQLYGASSEAAQPQPTVAPFKNAKSIGAPPPRAPRTDISEIGLERTRCYAACPAYTVVIQADGSFRYVGEYGVERLGEYRGTVDKGRLNQVLAFIAETEFTAFDTSYLASFLDGPTVYTLVVEGGDTKVVENYANTGPATLWAVEQLIDGLLETADWEAGGNDR